MRAWIDEIVFDYHDPARLVRFWAALLGGDPVDRSADWSYIDPPGFVRVAFQRVPEGKADKAGSIWTWTRGHRRGGRRGDATRGRSGPSGRHDGHGRFQVLRDPEGNEFCFVRSGGQWP
jgi:hypothetical protein